MNRTVALALLLSALGVAVHALVVEPERVRAAAIVEALELARRDHREARAELAALQAQGRRGARVADPVEVRARVLRVLEATPVRSVRLSVRPAADGALVNITGRARPADALLLAERLMEAGLPVYELRLTAGEADVAVALSAKAGAS